MEETKSLKDKIGQVGDRLLKPKDFLKGKTLCTSSHVLPGKKIGVNARGNAAIRHFEIQVSGVDKADYGDVMRSIVVRGTFDGVECVDVPLADFSGAGMGAAAVKSWYLYSDGQGLVVSRWVMPFRSSASLSLSIIGEKLWKFA